MPFFEFDEGKITHHHFTSLVLRFYLIQEFVLSILKKDNDQHENLLATLKKEVKLLLELSVTCKFIHEDNSCFNSLCGKF
jgi:hypothetical protein